MRYLSFLKINFNFPVILFITFSAIGSPDIVSSNAHPRYVLLYIYAFISNILSLLEAVSITSTFLCWNKMHESSAYESKVDLTA